MDMNKKKYARFILCLLLVISMLCGCAQKEIKPLEEAVSAALIGGTAGLVEFPADELEMIADITQDDFTECVYLVSEDGLSAREAIVLRAKDDAKARRIAENLEGYLTRRQNETRDYLPDDYALLVNAKVERKQNTVALIVGEQAAEETKRLLAGE